MNIARHNHLLLKRIWLLLLFSCTGIITVAQAKESDDKIRKASKKVESGIKKDNTDTLAQGYYEMGEIFYQKGEIGKSENYYQKAKDLFEKKSDADGIAKSSRALGRVQEDLNRTNDAKINYKTALDNSIKIGDTNLKALNGNDFYRLSTPVPVSVQADLIEQNINRSIINKDTTEVVSNVFRMANIKPDYKTIQGLTNGYSFSAAATSSHLTTAKKFFNTTQAATYNQLLTNAYLIDSNYPKAIEVKESLLNEDFVQNSAELKAKEISQLADIYVKKKQDSTAIRLLNECYTLSIQSGHTMQARECVEKLDSLFQSKGKKQQSLQLYRDFLEQLPGLINKDSTIAGNKIINETEMRIKQLEVEKELKDDLIRKKNVFNYWLIGLVAALILFAVAILYMLRKLRIRNKKIALQSLRREMNPHFIFNSLNSINQFIANNNELEANRYLTKFSTLMRRVMENSKEDFVAVTKEIELLQTYLELEQSRFPDKFEFNFTIDDELRSNEQLSMPGMLVQPHLENAIWHGLRYSKEKGMLQLSFHKKENCLEVIIEDNGIGIAESKKYKTANQQQHKGRGLENTIERIKILSELYQQHITCEVEDKTAPQNGVKVTMKVPLLKKPIA